MTEIYPDSRAEIAGTWRRIFAFAVDALLLALVGQLLGLWLADFFASLGSCGRLIGLAIALPYFGIMFGPTGGGQTLGHRLLEIRVCRNDGGVPTGRAAFVRAAVLNVPWFCNGLMVPSSLIPTAAIGWILGILLALIVAANIANLYLFLFNRRGHQALHDLAAGTHVVKVPSAGPVVARGPWPGHWAVAALLTVAGCLAFAGIMRAVGPTDYKDMFAVRKAVGALPNVSNVSINLNRFTNWQEPEGTAHTVETWTITIFCRKDPEDRQEIANEAANAALKSWPYLAHVGRLNVTVIRGFDIGIASRWTKYYFNYPANTRSSGYITTLRLFKPCDPRRG